MRCKIKSLSDVTFQKVLYLQDVGRLQQLPPHICLATLILSCCFAPFGRRASAARAKQQERINFAKQMCEKSC